jgi:hypothetical protein
MCLQFALFNAASCVLHRSTSRVIHRLEWYFVLYRHEVGHFTLDYQHRLGEIVGGILADAH